MSKTPLDPKAYRKGDEATLPRKYHHYLSGYNHHLTEALVPAIAHSEKSRDPRGIRAALIRVPASGRGVEIQEINRVGNLEGSGILFDLETMPALIEALQAAILRAKAQVLANAIFNPSEVA